MHKITDLHLRFCIALCINLFKKVAILLRDIYRSVLASICSSLGFFVVFDQMSTCLFIAFNKIYKSSVD